MQRFLHFEDAHNPQAWYWYCWETKSGWIVMNHNCSEQIPRLTLQPDTSFNQLYTNPLHFTVDFWSPYVPVQCTSSQWNPLHWVYPQHAEGREVYQTSTSGAFLVTPAVRDSIITWYRWVCSITDYLSSLIPTDYRKPPPPRCPTTSELTRMWGSEINLKEYVWTLRKPLLDWLAIFIWHACHIQSWTTDPCLNIPSSPNALTHISNLVGSRKRGVCIQVKHPPEGQNLRDVKSWIDHGVPIYYQYDETIGSDPKQTFWHWGSNPKFVWHGLHCVPQTTIVVEKYGDTRGYLVSGEIAEQWKSSCFSISCKNLWRNLNGVFVYADLQLRQGSRVCHPCFDPEAEMTDITHFLPWADAIAKQQAEKLAASKSGINSRIQKICSEAYDAGSLV